jgi:tetratricopeptide (TPR) repeat protein
MFAFLKNFSFALPFFRSPIIIGVSSVAVLGVVVVGSVQLISTRVLKNLEDTAISALEQGQYAEALVAYSELLEQSPDYNVEIADQIVAVRRLIVAEENYDRAMLSAQNEAWYDVRALLRGSDAISNPSFVHYEEAVELFARAEGQVSELNESVAAEIANLRQKASEEKVARNSAEKKIVAERNKATKQVQAVQDVQRQTAATLTAVQKELAEREQSTSAIESALAIEQARTVALLEAAAREQTQKFTNELSLYVSLLHSGDESLGIAYGEITANKESSALLYISQGKKLFKEVQQKAQDFRNAQSGESRIKTVGNVLSAIEKLNQAVRELSYAISASLGDENEAKEKNLANAVKARAEAQALLEKVTSYTESVLQGNTGE